MRKVVQMAANNGVLFVAADDGTVWWWGVNGWEAAPDLPTEPTPVQRVEAKRKRAWDWHMGYYGRFGRHLNFKPHNLGPVPNDEAGLNAWLAAAKALDEEQAEQLAEELRART